jgi:hypothetical protein
VRGDEGKEDGARVVVILEILARRSRDEVAVFIVGAAVVDVPVEDVDDGEEGCADCGGVKVNGACSVIFGCAVTGVGTCESVVGVSG